MNQGEPERAVTLMEETVDAGRAIGEIAGAVVTCIFLGGILLEAGDVVRGLALVEESLVQARQLVGDNVGYRLNVLIQAGDNLLRVPGKEDQAATLEHEGLELAQRVDQPYWEARARFVLGLIAVRRGDLVQARAQAVAALLVMRDQGVMLRVPLLLDELAIVAGREGQCERAARLLGAAASLRETSGATPDPALRAEVESMVPVVRATLGEADWAVAFAAGQALSLEEAIAEALGERE
jgi:non-specific serine/threonine protein kinase